MGIRASACYNIEEKEVHVGVVTMKDIAKMTGVSYGTVSNALNGRGNVSAEKIRLVEQAAKELGYSINAQAKNLRKHSSLSPSIAVILPNIVEDKYSFFYTTTKHYLEQFGYATLLFVTEDMPYTEEAAVITIAAIRAIGVIAITCCSRIDEVYAPLIKIGSSLVFAEREVPAPYPFIHFDMVQAANQIAEEINRRDYQVVGIMAGLKFFSNECEFVSALTRRLGTRQLRTVTSNINMVLKSAYGLIAEGIPDIIVTTSTHLAKGLAMALQTWKPDCPPPVLSLAPSSFLSRNTDTREYYLDYRKLGAKAAQLVVDAAAGNACQDGHREALPCDGFSKPTTALHIGKRCTLQVLMAENQSTEALMKLTPEFTQKTNIDIHYTVLPIRDMFDATMNTLHSGQFDVIRINIPTLYLISREMLIPIPQDTFHRITGTMFDRIVREYSYIDGVPVAIPFDVGLQLLVYRTDLFEDPMVKRMYFETYGTQLRVPTDFEEFNRNARFFTKQYNPSAPIEYGTSCAIGTHADILDQYLLKLMSFGGRFVDTAGRNSLEESIALKALENYRELMDYSIHLTDNYLFGEGIKYFIEGKTAMEIIQTNYSSHIIDLQKLTIGGRIGYGLIPVPYSLFGGGALAIPQNSQAPEAALQYIEWASDCALADLYTFLGGNSAQRRVYENEEILQVYPWYSLTNEVIGRSVASEIWSHINHEKIEQFVGATIQSVINGAMSNQEAVRYIKKAVDRCLI